MKKLIIISGPSGVGKSTIVGHLLSKINSLSFSVSATSRDKRSLEVNAKNYYFLSVDEFKSKIKNEDFLEWEEVYKNQFYGTLKSEIERIWNLKKSVVFDIDVVGALNIKRFYPKNSLSIFIMPPKLTDLKTRLLNRNTETAESVDIRLKKAKQEIEKSNQFDLVIINDNLEESCEEVLKKVQKFILN